VDTELYPSKTTPCCIWLDICEEPSDLVAEGSIHGSEELKRKVKKAKRAILKPEAGPSLALKREADRNWMLCQSVANLTSSIVVSNELATIVTTDVRCLPSGIFGRVPIYDVCAKHLHPVVMLVCYRAHDACSCGRTIIHVMKPTCPTCNRRMSAATGSMFICVDCRELDDSLPWWDKYMERPTNHQTKAWVSRPVPPKTQTPAG